VIPDEAVEAALNASLTFKNQRGMDNAANQMRHILEAAAPHMLNLAKLEAWDANLEIRRLRAELAKVTK
jgi:hypothetical protein